MNIYFFNFKNNYVPSLVGIFKDVKNKTNIDRNGKIYNKTGEYFEASK